MNYFQSRLKTILESSENRHLDLIRENPDDWGLKLQFADWLEERGDPLGQAIKLAYEIAHTPNVPEPLSFQQIQSQAEQRQQRGEPGSIYWDMAREADLVEEYLDKHRLPQLIEALDDHLYKYKIRDRMKPFIYGGLSAKLLAIEDSIMTLQGSSEDDLWHHLGQSSVPNVRETAELFKATISKLFKIYRRIGSIANSIWSFYP
jgi:uncharacterized protein (TIGR02996 family)